MTYLNGRPRGVKGGYYRYPRKAEAKVSLVPLDRKASVEGSEMDSAYKEVQPPEISESEYLALEVLESVPGGTCRQIRPDTLGHQQCWRAANHQGPHVSQDGKAWILVSGEVE